MRGTRSSLDIAIRQHIFHTAIKLIFHSLEKYDAILGLIIHFEVVLPNQMSGLYFA